jgi:hypothetical protein
LLITVLFKVWAAVVVVEGVEEVVLPVVVVAMLYM